ncbi:pilus assembly protein PilP [Bdellovibrio sp. HCB337]|uniref:pilus assembly protein PilP n=1 Tax=Bdellovibrio sp. HCB337 TaxID=3394358 RepID=UPI0039A6FD98
MKSTRWVITYIVVASLGLWGAFFMSLKFMTPGHAQAPEASGQPQKMEPPAPGDLPPEFLQETQNAPAPNGQIPPPPSQPPAQGGAAAVPQSPPQEIPPQGAPPAVPSSGAPPMVPPTMPVADPSQMPPPMEGSAPVIPQFASDEQYTYDPTGRRDPFKPYRTYRPAPQVTAGPAKVIDESDPLQRWDLDRFAVVAIIWEVRQPKAMVKDPDGKMFMIGKNTKIGRNSGHVAAIREGEVLVVELIETEGVQTKEVKILELKK